jgi:DNA-binding PadR family transcriptional regulator
MIDNIILGFLLDKEMTGYDIKQKINVSTANFYDASFGSIYPALKRLEAQKLIVSKKSIKKGKFKNIYHILNLGRQTFLDWVKEPLVLHQSRNEYLLKIFFYRHLSKDEVVSRITQFIKLLSEYKANLLKIEPLVASQADFFQMSTLRYGVDNYQFLIDWFQQYLITIDQEYSKPE